MAPPQLPGVSLVSIYMGGQPGSSKATMSFSVSYTSIDSYWLNWDSIYAASHPGQVSVIATLGNAPGAVIGIRRRHQDPNTNSWLDDKTWQVQLSADQTTTPITDDNFQFGVEYEYSAQVVSDSNAPSLGSLGTPTCNCSQLSPPSDNDSTLCPTTGLPCTCDAYIVHYQSVTNSTWGPALLLIPLQAQAVNPNVVNAQAVDSRPDPRKEGQEAQTNPFLDFQFGARTYRGGLFVGLAENKNPAQPNVKDNSGVARSFIRLQLPPWPGQAGSPTTPNIIGGAATVNVYYTGSLNDTDTTSVGCEVVSSAGWAPANLTWSTAPAFNAQSAIYLDVSGQSGKWCTWSMPQQIQAAWQSGDPVLSLGLGSLDETKSGWAYFAKKEYNPDLAPRVLFVRTSYPTQCN